jgi:hypothetical protein
MKAVGISETSVYFYETTLRKIAEDSHLNTGHRENLKFRISEKHAYIMSLSVNWVDYFSISTKIIVLGVR